MDGVCPSLKVLEGQNPLAEIVEPARLTSWISLNRSVEERTERRPR